MSLIEQALRRLQEPGTKPPQTSPAKAKPTTPEADIPAAHSWPTAPASSPATPSIPSTRLIIGVAVAVLVLTALLLIGGMIWIDNRLTPRPAVPAAAAPSASAEIDVSDESAQSEPELDAPAPAAEAPAIRLPWSKPPAASQEEFVLNGVAETPYGTYAVINGGIATVGEWLGEAQVVEITSNVVKLRWSDGRFTEVRLAK